MRESQEGSDILSHKSPEKNAFTKSLERKHDILMKSIEDSKILAGPEPATSPKNPEQIQDPEMGTFSQCYEQNEEALLSFEDVLTDEQTKNLWQRYFRHDSKVNADLFINCVAEEFKDLLNFPLEEHNNILHILKERISLDGENISLNALQVFTKENGLENSLKEIIDEAMQKKQKKKGNLQKEMKKF